MSIMAHFVSGLWSESQRTIFNVSCELSGAFYPLAEATHGTNRQTDRGGVGLMRNGHDLGTGV